MTDLLTRWKNTIWLYRLAFIAGLVFIALNAVDGYLTNYAFQQAGTRAVEANPFVQPFLGHWALPMKGIVGVGLYVMFALYKNLSPGRLFFWVSFGCVIFAGIIVWNMSSMGLL